LTEGIGPQLFLMNRDGGAQQLIHLGEHGPTNQVDWAPDGGRLLVTNSSSQALAVHTLGASGVAYIRPRPGSVNYPVWSPDGSLIAFTNGSDLIVIPSSGGDDRNLTGTLAATPTMVSWDGAGSLLFSAGSTVYRIGADGTGLAAIAQGCSSPAA
jgi:Tol biopolymer transport system component